MCTPVSYGGSVKIKERLKGGAGFWFGWFIGR